MRANGCAETAQMAFKRLVVAARIGGVVALGQNSGVPITLKKGALVHADPALCALSSHLFQQPIET